MANRLSATDDRREFPGIFYYTGGVDLCQCISCFSGDFPLFFACFGPENFITVPNQHHTFSDLREEPGNTGPSPLSGTFFHIHSKTACRGALAICGALPRRSRLPPRSVLGAPHRGAAPEPAGETKSFCPCQVYLPKMMQVRKKPGIPAFFRVSRVQKGPSRRDVFE